MALPPGFVLEEPRVNLPQGFVLETAPPPPEKQSAFRQVADIPLGIAKGAVQGVRMIADAFGAGSDTSKTIKSAETYLADLMSAQAKNDQQEISRIMKDAEDKGVLDQVKAGIKAFTIAPVDTLSSALGTAAPVIAGALGAKILGAGALVSTGVSALTGAGMGAGVVKGSIYEETKNALKEAGASEQEAEKRAQLAQEYGGKNLDQILLGTVLGGAAAVGPLEKGAAGILARRILGKTGAEATESVAEQAAKGAVRRRVEAGALEAIPEAVQAGQEQVAQNIALQREGFDVPTFRGAVSSATLEALAGAGLGSALGGGKPEVAPAPAPEVPPAPPAPPVGALEFKPEPFIQFPDGTVAKRSEVEAYIKTLPEDQQMAMRAKLLGLAPQEAEKEPAPPAKALEYKPEPLIVYPDGSVAKRSEVDAYIQGLPEDEQIPARAKLLGMGEEATQVTPEMLRKLGIRGRAPIIQRLTGLELTDPKVTEELTNFAQQPFASPEVRGNIFGFLNTIKPIEAPAAPETPAAPPVAPAPVSEAPPVVEPPAPPVTPTVETPAPAAETPAPPVEAAPPVEPAPVVEAAAPAEKPTFEPKIVSRQPAPDGMEVHVFTTTDGYGTGLFDADAGQYVDGSITRFAGADTLPKAQERAAEMLQKATPPAERPAGGTVAPVLSDFQKRLKDYWDNTATPAIRNYLSAINSFGIDRLEKSQIKPAGISVREWLESFVSKQSTWDKGRKTGETGIQALSTKNLWPTTDGSGERLRKAMLDAVKALKNAPGSTSVLVDQAFGESKPTTIAAPKAEAPAVEAPAPELTPAEIAQQIKDLKDQQTKLLTKAGKVPAPRSPARQKYDALSAQIADLEGKQLTVRSQKPRKRPSTIMGSPMLAGIFNQLGGLHTSLLSEFSTRFITKRIGRKGKPIVQMRNPLVPGYGTLFNKDGKFDFGEIAEYLEQEGYLEPGSLERDYKDAGERAKDLIKQALNREEVLPIQDRIDRDAQEREASERQRTLDRQEENRMIASGELQLEPEFEWTNEDIEKNLGLDQEFETDLEMYDLEPKDLEFLSDEELESELTDAEREQAQARRTRKAAEDAARQKAEGAAPGEDEALLTRPTAEGLRAKQEAAEKAAAEEKKAKAAEQERLRKEQQAKEEKARADETVKDFELGKSAEEQMTGMGDLFAVPPAAEKPPVGGFRRATAREANSDNAQFVYDVGNGARLLFVPSQNGDVYVAAPGKGASLVVRTGDNRDNVIKTVDQFPDYIPENIRQIVLDYHKAVQGKTTDEEQTAVAMEMAEKIEALTSTKKEAPPKREPRQGTPKQLETADGHAKSTGGTVVYQDGDIALVRGFSLLNGQPVYVVTNGDYRSRVDIEGYTGNLVTPEQKSNLVKIKQDLEAEDKAKFDKSPSIKFTDGLATSANVSPELAGIVRGWKELLGLKPNLYVTTIDDAVADRNKFTGPHRAVGSAGLDANEAGQVRRLPNGDYYIAFKKGTSKTKMLEVLAHELGHMHEREVFNNADADTKKKIREEHDKWLMSQKGRSARELIQSLRAKTSGKTTRVEKGLSVDQMTPYWKSFAEWYADQVSRWAVTSEKPVSVVEKFFSRLAQALKSFYSKIKNAGYLPNETFVQYLEKTHAPSDHVISTDDGSVQQMLGEAKAVAQKALQKQPMPEKGLSHVSKDLTNLAQPIFFPQNKTVLDRIDSMKDRFWQRLAQKTADQFRTIKEYSPLGYMQARLSKSVDGSLEGLLFHGQVFDDGGALNIKKNTKGMMDILKPIGNELDSYLMWVALNRESTLPDTKRSKIPNMDKLVARRSEFAAGELNGKPRVEVYQDVLKQMNQLNKSVLDIALAKGLIDQAGYDKFSNDIYYIPFYKKMEEDGTIEGAQTASGLTSQYFSKELKGGEAPFGDLMENIVRNWSHILSASMKNAAAQTTLNDAMELQAAEPNLKAGLEWKDGKVYSTKSGKPIEAKFDEDGTQLYAEGELRPDLTTGAAGMAKVMVNGQPMYFKVTDDLLMDSISSIGYLGPKSKFLDVARGFKNMLQYGVTASPIFKVNNLIRDSVSALAVSDLKKSPVSNVMKGISLSKPDSPTYISALAGGAIFNFGSAYEGDQAKLIKRLIDQGVEGDTILDSKEKITKALKKTWDAYQHLGDRSEAANRLALYQQLRDKGMSHLEASFMARDLLDFSMQGSWPAFRLITQVVPFMNARIQGLYKLGRDGINPTVRVLYNATTGKEIDANDKIRAAQFATVSAAVMLASALLYLTFKDDEDFKKRDAWDRDNFWWFKIPSLDIAFRVPKPFEVGAFGTLVERSLEQILDEGAEGKTFGESLKRTLWDTFALNPTPQMFKPLLDIYANKDSFSGAPIESAGLERLSKQERVTEQTSPLAIAMSAIWSTFMPEKLESSPVQMDYAIKGYFGWLGAMASLTSTYAVMPFKEGEYPDARWLDRASLGLVRDLPAPQSAYVTAFYNASKEISQAYADMRHYREMGDAEKVQELLEEKGDKIALAKFYDKTAKNIANVRKQIQLITNDKNLDGAEKKEMIERMKLIMSDLAKQAEEVRKSMKQ